jgi:hypothetical protein
MSRTPRSTRPWLVVGGVLALEAAFAFFWYSRLSVPELRHWLIRAQFWSLEAGFLSLVLTSALAGPPLIRSLGISRRWWLAALLLSAAAVILALTLPPRTSRILYDEQIYQNVGQSMSDLRLAQMCNSGIVEYGQLECLEGEYNKEPYAYPYLLSLAYRVVGTHERVAFDVNALAHGVLVLVMFITAARLTGDPRAGFLSGLAITLLPEQLHWVATAAAEPTTALASLIAVLATIEYCRSRTTPALAWAVCASAFAVQFRPESGLIVFVVALIILVEAGDELVTPRMGWALAAGAAFLFIHLGHMLAVRNESWGTVGPPFATMYISGNLRANFWFFVLDHRFLIGLLPAAVVGWRWGAGPFRMRTVLAVYALLFWLVFLGFYAGSYNYGADVRYSLMTYPPLMLLAGLGLATVADRIPGAVPRVRATAIVSLALVWVFLYYTPYVRATTEEGWGAREDVEFARAVSRELPRQSLVLTHDPNMFLIWGRNARQMAMLPSDVAAVRDLARRHGGHLYLHWGFWCNVADPRQVASCKDLLARFPTELVREQYQRDYRYAFYLITPDGVR